jgi:Holliday junction resolvase-like predicted endonuclease
MTAHLIVKFHYAAWNKTDSNLITIDEHRKVIQQQGSVWWGRVSGISRDKAEMLRAQLEAGEKTYLFLLGILVPKNVHPDTRLWYRAELRDLCLGTPKEKELIPQYYRDANLEVAFKIDKIEPIVRKPGTTPKVPGQASIRYVYFKDGKQNLESLASLSDNSLVCLSSDSVQESLINEAPPAPLLERKNISAEGAPLRFEKECLLERVVELQDDVISLQKEAEVLRSYKDYYNKIISLEYLFSSERLLESWLEDNIHKILPELEIIDRQPSAAWKDGKFGRLDLLAKNRENHSLVIIEVKTRKRNIKSGYDQFVRYTSWAKKYRDELAQKYSAKGLRATERPQFFIITDYVDDEMKEVCRDNEITLIHLFGGLGFERAA